MQPRREEEQDGSEGSSRQSVEDTWKSFLQDQATPAHVQEVSLSVVYRSLCYIFRRHQL